MSTPEKTNEEKLMGLVGDIVEMFAPDLAEALQELSDQMGRPVSLNFKSEPQGDEVTINASLGPKVKIIEHEEVAE